MWESVTCSFKLHREQERARESLFVILIRRGRHRGEYQKEETPFFQKVKEGGEEEGERERERVLGCDYATALIIEVDLHLPRINISADVWGGSSIMTGVC